MAPPGERPRRRARVVPGRRAPGRGVADLRPPAHHRGAAAGGPGGQRQARPPRRGRVGPGRAGPGAARADDRGRPRLPPLPQPHRGAGRRMPRAGPGRGHHLRPRPRRARLPGGAGGRVRAAHPRVGTGARTRRAADARRPGAGGAGPGTADPPPRPGGAVRGECPRRATHRTRRIDRHGGGGQARGERLRRAADAGDQGRGSRVRGIPGLRRCRPASAGRVRRSRPATGRGESRPRSGSGTAGIQFHGRSRSISPDSLVFATP